MFKLIRISLLFLLFIPLNALGEMRYGEKICKQEGYHCLRITKIDSWDDLFPDLEQQDLIKRVNRMNIELKSGMTIAVPNNLENLSIYDVSPFPRYINPTGEKTIYVNQDELAWGAYDEQGELIWWGPLSSGSGRCKNIEGQCKTPSGEFRIIRKQDYDCVSTAFPQYADGSGGAEMPYCMHFYMGYALHGSETVPGYRASHGCVRMFVEDARWLNEEFIDLPGAGGLIGTRVIID